MKLPSRILLLLTIPSLMMPAQQTLNALRDRSRVLLVFAPDASDRRFDQQLGLLDHHAADLQSRDLVYLPVIPDSSLPSAAPILRQLQSPLVHDDEKITLRHRFHVGPQDFAVILLGKDGGEKLRSSTPVSVTRLNKLIDAMPMRQQEMRSRR